MGPLEDVVILCGGRGTRLQHHAAPIPKALVEIGDEPILAHVIRIYAAHGVRRFWLCTGFEGRQIERFVASARWPQDLEVTCLDTGLDTPTGGRLARAAAALDGREAPFFATYVDGLADIDVQRLAAFHVAHGALATVTVVRPPLPFGVADLDGDGRVVRFREKPRLERWVNGGFFVFSPPAARYLGDDSVLEREPLERLAEDGELRAFRHTGFWECMDTYKDALRLNDLWARGDAPWRRRG